MKKMSNYVLDIEIFIVYRYNYDGDNMHKKRKLNTKNLAKLITVIILIIISIMGIKTIIYRNSNEYKLKEIGYNNNQIEEIKKLDKKFQVKILETDYDEFLITLFNEKYFNFDNFDRYIKLHLEDKDMVATNVVAIVNVNSDYEQYTETKETDISKDTLMLVNKYNYLPKNYEPDDIVDIKNWYAYGENQIREEVYDKFIDMFNAAKKEGLTLIITSGYRDEQEQTETYEDLKYSHSTEEADRTVARPGFSEHQTGLCLDIVTYDVDGDEFEQTAEFKWMSDNAYKYGFILRYPKGKEMITGYDYESWHYRYVGEKAAKEIKDLDITFDEYYEYYIK